MRLLSNRKVQLVLNGGFGLVLLAVAVVSVRHFAAPPPPAPLAAVGSRPGTARAGFALVAAAGIVAAAIAAFLPRLAVLPFVTRWRAGRWLAGHTHCTKEAWAAWLLISVSWS